MKYLYKYPQSSSLIETWWRPIGGVSRQELEYELLDTGIFDEDRYFDVFVEYAKETPENILIRITVLNHGPEPATLCVLPTLWFEIRGPGKRGAPACTQKVPNGASSSIISTSHPELGDRFLYCDGAADCLFTENETNNERLFDALNATPYVKDGINDYIVHGHEGAVNPQKVGTKAAAAYRLTLAAGTFQTLRLRLSDVGPAGRMAGNKEQKCPFRGLVRRFNAKREREAERLLCHCDPITRGIPTRQASCAKHSPGCCGPSNSTTMTSTCGLEQHNADPFKATHTAPRK